MHNSIRIIAIDLNLKYEIIIRKFSNHIEVRLIETNVNITQYAYSIIFTCKDPKQNVFTNAHRINVHNQNYIKLLLNNNIIEPNTINSRTRNYNINDFRLTTPILLELL
jgi:hypothetical protein